MSISGFRLILCSNFQENAFFFHTLKITEFWRWEFCIGQWRYINVIDWLKVNWVDNDAINDMNCLTFLLLCINSVVYLVSCVFFCDCVTSKLFVIYCHGVSNNSNLHQEKFPPNLGHMPLKSLILILIVWLQLHDAKNEHYKVNSAVILRPKWAAGTWTGSRSDQAASLRLRPVSPIQLFEISNQIKTPRIWA